ncbi:erythromycin esterase [Sporosarcina luteola]|nr:erythromycin esterase [Sporosarcina luteola]
MNKKKTRYGMAALVSVTLLTSGCGVEKVEKENLSLNEVLNSAQSTQNDIVMSIESQVKPLKTIDPTQPFDDLKPFKDMIGSADYVGLGESTHGSSEIFTLKFRLVKYLVTEMGFTNFGLEEDWGNGLKLNEYIQTGKGNPREFLSLLYPADEIIAMIDWMKDYNADPSNEKKIQFIGLDLKALDPGVFNKVIDYVKQHRPAMLSEVEESYKGLPAMTGSLQEYMKLSPEEKERFKANAEKVVRLLNDKTKLASTEIDLTELIWVRATAKTIEEFTTMMIPSDYPSLLKLHEQYLADHAMWAKEELGGKTIVWAHNLHVAKGIIDDNLYPFSSGQFLKERLGDQYVVVGSTTMEGKFTLYSSEDEYSPTKENKITNEPIPQDETSSNYMLGNVAHEMFLLDNRKLNGQAKHWVKEKRPLLSLGGQLLAEVPVYFETSLLEQFDIIFHIRNTSPSHIK